MNSKKLPDNEQPKIDVVLFVGLESHNLDQFASTCCDNPLSLEPLCRVCCGKCGNEVLMSKQYKVRHA